MKPAPLFIGLLLATSAHAQDLAPLTRDTRDTVLPVIPKVVGAMQHAVEERGTAEAIPVCRDQAPALLAALREKTGWSIRRVSLKTRNPERGTPDAWETETLRQFDARQQAGEMPSQIERSAIVQEGGQTRFRYMKALPVAPVCTQCHGPLEQLDPVVQRSLQQHYPQDQATGYQAGQIRGALSVSRPL